MNERTLVGKSVLVTRPREDAVDFGKQLVAAGADTSFLPLITCVPRPLTTEMAQTYSTLHTYDWLVFTSVNGVRAFFRGQTNVPSTVRIAAVGTETAAMIKQYATQPVLTPLTFDGETLATLLLEKVTSAARVLVVCGQLSRRSVTNQLRSYGVHVDELILYDTFSPSYDAEKVATLSIKIFDYVTLFSSSAARHLDELQQKASLRFKTVACIGPRTANTARELGLEPIIVADVYTASGLLTALQQHARSEER
ncbi:uroporphyrinogen-III synthase [Bacillus sp. FSL W7-1360]